MNTQLRTDQQKAECIAQSGAHVLGCLSLLRKKKNHLLELTNISALPEVSIVVLTMQPTEEERESLGYLRGAHDLTDHSGSCNLDS